MTFTVDPEIQSLIPPLTAEERDGLEASITREGCRDPLVVWCEAGVLLDGHNRHDICRRLGKPYNTTGLSFADRSAALAWVIENQIGRRNLNAYQKAELHLRLEDVLRPAAEARMLAGKAADPSQNSDQGRVIDRIALAAGLSADTIQRVKVIRDKAPEPVKEALRRGETSVNAEYLKLRNPGLMLSSVSNEWYTPAEIIEAAREVMGGIDLDPASCEEANCTVQASRFYDEDTDGLAQEWHGRVWLNPPYGGLAGSFTDKLLAEYRSGRTVAALSILSAGATTTRWFQPLFDFPLCFYSGRVAFRATHTDKASNTVGSVLAYLGPDVDRFAEVFERFGPVVARYRRQTGALAAVQGA